MATTAASPARRRQPAATPSALPAAHEFLVNSQKLLILSQFSKVNSQKLFSNFVG
jgi:hypothetical protein